MARRAIVDSGTVGGLFIQGAVGDFDGDGNLDFTAPREEGGVNLIGVFLGKGDGTFKPRVDVSTGSYVATGFVTGDWNGDGKLDIAVSGQNPSSNAPAVSVLLGNGDGTFQTHVDIPSVDSFNAILTSDLDGDGKADLALARTDGTNGVSVMLGNGDRTFHAHVEYATDVDPRGLALGDINGDCVPDLVTANIPGGDKTPVGSISVLLGNGDGTFQTHIDFPAGGSTASVVIGDFNGDGRPDVATGGDAYASAIYVLLSTSH